MSIGLCSYVDPTTAISSTACAGSPLPSSTAAA
eukprot:CAMPEP_0205942978 /NCGR_PEP_ID=MMETSP1325-20131115/59164_1 /ASSEMBLY_ACC=CAM_ASM_000708 /TAXON_ID=236786 /ORGANISM="Florenciella sp., Strain RCC1007" /LENGTH=32 /DNA_ID= /DNA_START= /DNA_END= /DNA_ORIENTATION=